MNLEQKITALSSKTPPTVLQRFKDVGETIYFADVDVSSEEQLDEGIYKYKAGIYYKQFTKSNDDEKAGYEKDADNQVYKAAVDAVLLSNQAYEEQEEEEYKLVVPCVHRGDHFESISQSILWDSLKDSLEFGKSLGMRVSEDGLQSALEIYGFFKGLSYGKTLGNLLKAEANSESGDITISGEGADEIKLLVRIDGGDSGRPRLAYLPIHPIESDNIETEDEDEDDCDSAFPGSEGGGTDLEMSEDIEDNIFADQGQAPNKGIDYFPGKAYPCW